MKIIGSIFILISAVSYSYFYESSCKSKINDLKHLKNFFEYIKTQIEYFSYPLDLIFKQYSEKTDIITQLIETRDCKIKNKELGQTVNQCISNLGKGYKKEQLNLLEYTINAVSKTIEELKQVNPQKIKINRSLSLFVASCVIILLI